MSTFQAPKGTLDILAPDSERWRLAHRIFDDLAEIYGYGLALTPYFEDTEVFSRGVGSDTDVVEKQMYTFTDRGNRSITLRPEATASIVRAAIQSGGVHGTTKMSYWGPMFRYERPQKGRYRQFYQGGIEYLGSASAEADVEVIDFGYRYLQRMQVPDIEVRLNSIGDPGDRVRYRKQLQRFLNERRNELSTDAQTRIESNPMRVLDSKADADIVSDAPTPSEHMGPESQAHFADVRSGLESLSIPYTIDERLVRGLDYYNRTVWEYVPGSYDAAQSSVGGGGRYDGLFEVLGGKSTPAVGLAMGIDRVLLASTAADVAHVLDAFVVVIDDSRRREARIMVTSLRQAGLRVDMAADSRSVKGQFKDADRRGAARAIVVGDEWAEGDVTVKDLTNASQERIKVEDIESWLRA